MIIKEEDTILIQETLDGNQAAQKTLYDKYKIIVKNYLKFKYPNSYEIDDDVSEIMISVIMDLQTFDATKGKFKTWVMTIAKNHMIDRWRDKKLKLTSFDNVSICTLQMDGWSESYTAVSNDGFANTSVSVSDNVNSVFTSTNDLDNCSSINFISTQLSPSDYTLLNMKYVQGYNYREIGSEFNATSSTISNKVNYIKTKLKKNYPELVED